MTKFARSNGSPSCGHSNMVAYHEPSFTMPLSELSEEPPQLIYTLPIRPLSLYTAVFLPLVCRVVLVTAALAALMALAGAGPQVVATLVLHALIAALVFFSIGTSACVATYPDGNRAVRRFLIWLVVLGVAVVSLYPLRFVTAALAVMLSLALLRRKHFYRT